ncbi:MAG: hypothetical protein WBD31_04405 [Rubripirellula sp.]
MIRLLLIVIFASIGGIAFAGDADTRCIIHLIDPRGVAASEQTIPTGYGKARADILGTRTLSTSESRQLLSLLKTELVDDANVPFCGHSPAYAVQVSRSGMPTRTVTLCGFCGTWARDGELRALHGKKSLQYLEVLLPLPDVFRGVAKLSDLPGVSPFGGTPTTPFYKLDAAKSDEP